MPIPDFQTLMLPLMELTADGDDHRLADLQQTLKAQFALSDDEAGQLLPSGRQTTFANRVGWAATHLRKAGVLESNGRGFVRITPRGRELLGENLVVTPRRSENGGRVWGGGVVMARPAATDNPPCPRCGQSHTVRTGHTRGRQRWSCGGCGRTFGPTTGTPLFRLQTPATEVAQALLIVQRRGSLLAAEERTGHKYETIGRWLRRAGAHADALTAALVHDLPLTAVEVDEFWSFVHTKGRQVNRLALPPRGVVPVSGGGA